MSDTLISFSAALEAVKSGKAIRRAGWSGSGLSVKAQYPDAHSKMRLPYIYIEYPDNSKTTQVLVANGLLSRPTSWPMTGL